MRTAVIVLVLVGQGHDHAQAVELGGVDGVCKISAASSRLRTVDRVERSVVEAATSVPRIQLMTYLSSEGSSDSDRPVDTPRVWLRMTVPPMATVMAIASRTRCLLG